MERESDRQQGFFQHSKSLTGETGKQRCGGKRHESKYSELGKHEIGKGLLSRWICY